MPLEPLDTYDLIAMQSEAYAAQADEDPVSDGQNEPLGDIWGATALLSQQVGANIDYVEQKSRLDSAVGEDVDSFCEPFSVYRVDAKPADVVLSVTPRSIASIDTAVAVGSIFQTPDGLQFRVIADSTKPAYTGLGYIIPANTTAAISVSAICSIPGPIGIVGPNTITDYVAGYGQVSPGSFLVTNPAASSGGAAREDDATYKQRFKDTIISGRWGTALGILVAIATAYTGLTFQLYEAKNPDGSDHPGYFTVFANIFGASTATSQPVLDAIKLQIALVKALGITFQVVAPTLTVVPAAAQFVIDPNFVSADVIAAAQLAYKNYVNSIGLDLNGQSTLLSYAKVSAVLVTVPGVKNVLSFTLNGGTADITAAVGRQFVAGTTTFTAA